MRGFQAAMPVAMATSVATGQIALQVLRSRQPLDPRCGVGGEREPLVDAQLGPRRDPLRGLRDLPSRAIDSRARKADAPEGPLGLLVEDHRQGAAEQPERRFRES